MMLLAILFAVLCQLSGTYPQLQGEAVPDTGTCQSEFLEQPPDQLACNPYPNTELKLDCIVSIPFTGPFSGRLRVGWFHSSMQPGTPENQLVISRLDHTQEDITIQEQSILTVNSGNWQKRMRSRLEVRRLDEHNIGRYWCGIRIDSSEWMLLSDPLLLELPGEYTGLEPCSTTMGQSKRERKCATWSFTVQPTSPQPMYTIPPLPSTSLPATTETLTTSDGSGQLESTLITDANTTDEEATTSGELVLEENSEGLGLLTVVAISVLATFGAVIMGLAALVCFMCIKYRRITRARRKRTIAEEKGPRVTVQTPSTMATDYLVPISTATTEQRRLLQSQPRTADNPVYMSDLRQEFTSLWLERQDRQPGAGDRQKQQQQQRSDLLEHSYESMAHDYEDIFLESLNSISGSSRHPVLMKANEAYTIPRSLRFNIDPRMLPLY